MAKENRTIKKGYIFLHPAYFLNYYLRGTEEGNYSITLDPTINFEVYLRNCD